MGSRPPQPKRHISDKNKDDPLGPIDPKILENYIREIHEQKFTSNAVTFEELLIGAKLAGNFNNHAGAPPEPKEKEKARDKKNKKVPDNEKNKSTEEVIQPEAEGRTSIQTASPPGLLEIRQRKVLDMQRSMAFWRESKDLLITLLACCMASLTQGWDQVANGNLHWPKELGLNINPDGTGEDIWKFGLANAITWFSAATLGCLFIDPICHSRYLGRRGSVFLAALFSFVSVIGCSRAKSWQGYIIWRFFLGLGIGAKASIVPIWESEILPPSNRGRLLVLWQVFVATGIFVGSIATYIFRSSWRSQVLTGAIPALILLVLVYNGSESPRWLILQGEYVKAFETLVKLRKERLLAAEELCFIHFQVQTERAAVFGEEEPKYGSVEPRMHLSDRISKIFRYPRNLRAALATMIVMISQQLSGINILAFFASSFFNVAGFQKLPTDPNSQASKDAATRKNADDSLRLSIGFGVANAIFSLIAFFLIERENPNKDLDLEDKPMEQGWHKKLKPPKWALGRRSLLLLSLAGGALMLFILTFLLTLKSDNPAKLPTVMLFVILFTLFYSPGAGAVPFVYSAEVWPNEGREIGMSFAVFCNFIGAGFLALFVPRGLQWGESKLFGLFTGLSLIGFILVFLYVPSPRHSMTLEAMSAKFDERVADYAKRKIRGIPRPKWKVKFETADPAAPQQEPSRPDTPETIHSDISNNDTERRGTSVAEEKGAGDVNKKDGTVDGTKERNGDGDVNKKDEVTASTEGQKLVVPSTASQPDDEINKVV